MVGDDEAVSFLWTFQLLFYVTQKKLPYPLFNAGARRAVPLLFHTTSHSLGSQPQSRMMRQRESMRHIKAERG
jgi:hypothetical protein